MMLKREGADISEAYLKRQETQQAESKIYPREEHAHSFIKIKESIISWQTLIACVKEKYLQSKQVKTIFGKTQDIASCNINLTIVDKKKQNLKNEKWLYQERLNSYEEIPGEKKILLPQDIFFYNDKGLKRQVILGRAGIGKSTLCQYLAYQWAKEEWWKERSFKLLMWIPLRQLMDKGIYPKGELISLGKIFYEQCSEQLERVLFLDKEKWISVLDNLISEHSEEILYVLDGFDEVASVCQLSDSQAIHQIEMLRFLLSQEQVVVTSRPYYIEDYLASHRIKVSRYLESMGLVNENIQNYIQHYPWKISSQQKALRACLNSSNLMRRIAHIPINLVLLCNHWCMHQEIKAFSFSMTSLYKKLVGDFLREYLEKAFSKDYINFDNESEDKFLESETIQPILIFLEKLAFLQVQENTLLIGQTRIDELLKELAMSRETLELKRLLDAGLLVSLDKETRYFKKEKIYTFIHLTFQEFLAAHYIARVFKQDEGLLREVDLLTKDKLNQSVIYQSLEIWVRNHKYDLRLELVWWFVAGLLKEHSSGLDKFFNCLLSIPRDLSGSYDILLWIKCLEESELTYNLNETLKLNLIAEIRKRAQILLDQNGYIFKEEQSKTFFECLYSSPMVYEKLSILQTEKTIRENLKILQWHSNLPLHVLNVLINLLSDEDENIRNLALTAFNNQKSFSFSVLNGLVDMLKAKDCKVNVRVVDVLNRQGNLPLDVLNKLINFLNDKDVYVRYEARDVLEHQNNSPLEILSAMINLLRDKEKDVGSWTYSILNCPDPASLDILIILVTLLSNKNKEIREAACCALGTQKNLPPSVFILIKGLLEDWEPDVRIAALHVLSRQTNLSPEVLHTIAHSLKDPVCGVRFAAHLALKRQVNLPPDILCTLISLLGEWAECVLGCQKNLPSDILHTLVDLLSNEKGQVKIAALRALNGQRNLSLDILEIMSSLLNDKEADVKEALQRVFCHQKNLPLNVLIFLISSLSDKDEKVSSGALRALRGRKKLPPEILSTIMNLVRDKNENISSWAQSVIGYQVNLPLNILVILVNLLNDENNKISSWAHFTLGYQVNLPPHLLNVLVALLNDKEAKMRNVVLSVLSFQSNLPLDILNKIVDFIVNKNQVYKPDDEEVNFICRQLVPILDNPILQSQLSSSAFLLSSIILKKSFSSKSVAYFENNQSLIIRLGQQLKQITIKDKSEFIQAFIEQRKFWLNNQEADYLLPEITNSLSAILLK